MKNILVTGADGYIGKELILFLLDNDDNINIYCLSKLNESKNSKIKRFNCRFEKIENIINKLPKIHCLIHLAFSNSNNLNKKDNIEK